MFNQEDGYFLQLARHNCRHVQLRLEHRSDLQLGQLRWQGCDEGLCVKDAISRAGAVVCGARQSETAQNNAEPGRMLLRGTRLAVVGLPTPPLGPPGQARFPLVLQNTCRSYLSRAARRPE